jgi:dGTP triphosphohydrolase
MSQVFANLSDQPATHSGVTFDRNMMQIAQSVLEANGLDQKRAAAAVTGIAVDTYRYQRPAFYTPEAMNALLANYKAAGWKHLVNANQTAANTAQPEHVVTDLWLHFSGADIDAVTVLTRGVKTMNVVRVTGDLRPLDLLHLGGHFGIPKVDPSAVMVPDGR